MKSPRKPARPVSTAFVPRVVFQSLFVGVVPAIAAGCSSTANPDAQADVRTDMGQIITLAMVGFDAEADVPNDATQDATQDVTSEPATDAGFDAGPRDEGIIVLAQIGFEIDPDALRDTLLADAPVEATRRTPRRGRV